MGVNRDAAWTLLCQHTKTASLRRHGLAVEAAMRRYANEFQQDEEKWAVVGLLHDFDYESHPDPESHPEVGARILENLGYPADVIYAIKSHADYLGLPRRTLLDKTLFAVDELCGFITAVTLVRPGKLVSEVPVKSVKKKLKDKAFARTVCREDIRSGAKDLGITLDQHIATVIEALTTVAEKLGLAGSESRVLKEEKIR